MAFKADIDEDDMLAVLGLVSMSDAKVEAETIDKLQDISDKFYRGDFSGIDDDKNHQNAVKCRKLSSCTRLEKDHRQAKKPRKQRADDEVKVQPQPHSGQGSMNDCRTYEAPEFGYSIDRTKLPEHPPIESLKGKIGECGKPFEKQLTKSDLQDNQNRLSFPKEDVKLAFQPLLRLGEEDPANGIQVTVYDPMGNAYEMRYKTWANAKAHVLIGGWKKFYDEHDFRANEDWVSVWMFRHKDTGKICIALTWKRFPTREPLARRKARND